MRIALLLPVMLAAPNCAAPSARPMAAAAPYTIMVASEGGACRIVAGGRPVAAEELTAVVREAAPAGRAVLIRTDRNVTIYRCIGGTIYAVQRAGVRDIAFDPPWPEMSGTR